MFYIRKWINIATDWNITWSFIYSENDNRWVHIYTFAEGYTTRKEAEDKLVELGLIEDTTGSEEDGKVSIIWLDSKEPQPHNYIH
jgi:hypothetical protein